MTFRSLTVGARGKVQLVPPPTPIHCGSPLSLCLTGRSYADLPHVGCTLEADVPESTLKSDGKVPLVPVELPIMD